MATLDELVAFCDSRLRRREIADFPGAHNGLQVANPGRVTRLAAAVDAGAASFARAAAAGVNFLIVHHGLFWDGVQPVTGSHYARLKTLLDAGCAVYAAHLPLDAHPEIGNNAVIARELGLPVSGWEIPYQGTPLAAMVTEVTSRGELRARLQRLFPDGVRALEFGPSQARKTAILSGSGSSALPQLAAAGVDTFITGEVKQSAFTFAQEAGLNLFICGHYATEVFGVRELARECALRFGLPWEFLDTGCPL